MDDANTDDETTDEQEDSKSPWDELQIDTLPDLTFAIAWDDTAGIPGVRKTDSQVTSGFADSSYCLPPVAPPDWPGVVRYGFINLKGQLLLEVKPPFEMSAKMGFPDDFPTMDDGTYRWTPGGHVALKPAGPGRFLAVSTAADDPTEFRAWFADGNTDERWELMRWRIDDTSIRWMPTDTEYALGGSIKLLRVAPDLNDPAVVWIVHDSDAPWSPRVWRLNGDAGTMELIMEGADIVAGYEPVINANYGVPNAHLVSSDIFMVESEDGQDSRVVVGGCCVRDPLQSGRRGKFSGVIDVDEGTIVARPNSGFSLREQRGSALLADGVATMLQTLEVSRLPIDDPNWEDQRLRNDQLFYVNVLMDGDPTTPKEVVGQTEQLWCATGASHLMNDVNTVLLHGMTTQPEWYGSTVAVLYKGKKVWAINRLKVGLNSVPFRLRSIVDVSKRGEE